MKLVTVIIKPFKLDDVREALSAAGVHGLTVSVVKKGIRSSTAARNMSSTSFPKSASTSPSPTTRLTP